MNNAQALKMLESKSKEAKQNVIRYFLKRGIGDDFSSEVRSAIVKILNNPDLSYDEIREVVLRNPCPEFLPSFHKILTEGHTYEQQRGLECLEFWIGSGLVDLEEMKQFAIRCSRSNSSWVRFLAYVMLARHFEVGASAWEQAASAIVSSDYDEWWRSLRPQAEEILLPSELSMLNRELEKSGSKTI